MTHFRDKPTAGTVDGNELLWLVDDPAGSPADTKATVDAIVARVFALAGFNEAAQDAIGPWFAANGGTYNDAGGTVTFPLPDANAITDATASGKAILKAADYAAVRTLLGLVIGTNVQAADAALTALSNLSGTGVVVAGNGDTFTMRAVGVASPTDLPDRAAADIRYAPAGNYAPASAMTAPVTEVEVTAGGTLALVQATHQGATITLSGASATFSANATTLGNGFAFTIKNRTGSDFIVPPFTGATREYAKAAAHTKIASGSDAAVEVYTRNGAMFVSIMGDTL